MPGVPAKSRPGRNPTLASAPGKGAPSACKREKASARAGAETLAPLGSRLPGCQPAATRAYDLQLCSARRAWVSAHLEPHPEGVTRASLGGREGAYAGSAPGRAAGARPNCGWSPTGEPLWRPAPPSNRLVRSVDTSGGRSDNTRLVFAEGYPSGQRGQTVNLLAMPS
jgi:hypothetical protein